MSYHSGRVAVVNLETGHCFNDGHDGLDSIAINHCSVLLALILRVAVFVNDPGEKCKVFMSKFLIQLAIGKSFIVTVSAIS